MPKHTTVIEFEDKELRDLLMEKAKTCLGKPTNSGATIEIEGTLGNDARGVVSGVTVRVTFAGKVER